MGRRCTQSLQQGFFLPTAAWRPARAYLGLGPVLVQDALRKRVHPARGLVLGKALDGASQAKKHQADGDGGRHRLGCENSRTFVPGRLSSGCTAPRGLSLSRHARLHHAAHGQSFGHLLRSSGAVSGLAGGEVAARCVGRGTGAPRLAAPPPARVPALPHLCRSLGRATLRSLRSLRFVQVLNGGTAYRTRH